MHTYTCPIHGEISEESYMNSSGGKFCGVLIDDTDEVCMKPLELNTDANISQ